MTPFVYLHGFASSPASRKAQYFRERFAAAGIELSIPHLDGGDFERMTLSSQLGVIARAAGGRPVRLIGSSMGGYLAALYAARHPEVERVLLLAPAFDFRARWTAWQGAEKMDQWRRTGKLSVYHYAAGEEVALSYAMIEDAAAYEDFPEVRQPALIFHGTRDDVVPWTLSERFARGRDNVILRPLDSDHELGDVLDRMWEEGSRFLLEDRAL